MAGQQPSDDELIARARTGDEEILARFKTRDRMTWRMMWILTSGIALLFAATATAIFSGHAALVTGMWGRIVIATVFGALVVYVFATIGKYAFQSTEIRRRGADSPRLLHGRMDIYHRTWRRLVLFNVVTMFSGTVGLPRAFPLLRAAHQWLILTGAGIAFAGCLLFSAFILSAGPGWESSMSGARELPNDEFDSALRARTMRLGYRLAMLMLSAALLVSLSQPDLTLTALAWGLYASFALPALYYVVADWRASRGDES